MPKASLLIDNGGFSLIEALLAGALFSILSVAFISASIYGVESAALAGKRAQATLLAEEGLEAARSIRDAAFAGLTDGTFGLSASGAEWALSGSSDVNDIFTRSISIATVDDYKEVTSLVTWRQNEQRDGSVTLVTRFTDWLRARMDWTVPKVQSRVNLDGASNGLKVVMGGNYVYIIRSGGSPDFAVIDISNLSAPSMVGSAAISGTPTGIAISGDYVYVTSTDNSAELQIIDVTVPTAPTLVGTYDSPGNANGSSVMAEGTTVYLGTVSGNNNPELAILNISNPSSPSVIGSLDLAGDPTDMVISGTSLLVTSTDNNSELQVVNITDLASPTFINSLNFAGNSDAGSIVLFGIYAAIGRLTTGSIEIVDLTIPSTPISTTTIDAGAPVNDLAVISDTYVLVGSDLSTGEFRVLDITSPTAPAFVGLLNTVSDVDGVIYDATLDRAFAVTEGNAEEFMIISP